MTSNILHGGFVSSVKFDNLTPFYTTTSENEIIEFKGCDGRDRNINALTIEAGDKDLYIRIFPTDYCLFVASGQSKSIDFQSIRAIQVMGASGQKVRWSGQFY